MTALIVGGQPVEIEDKPLTVVCHPGEMEVEAPNNVLIDPESTVKLANELEQDQWARLREHPRFLEFWGEVWDSVAPPVVLAKSNLAIRHVVGMILLLVECKAEHRSPFLKLPETYLHPKQQANLLNLVYAIFPNSKGSP